MFAVCMQAMMVIAIGYFQSSYTIGFDFKNKMMKNKVALMMLRIFCETHAYIL